MNYLVAVDTFFPDRPTGSARVAWDIAQLMRGRGHKVAFFCRKQKPEDEEIASYENIVVVRFQVPKAFSLDPFKVQKQIRAGVQLAEKHLADTKWDVAHIHTDIQGNIINKLLGPDIKYVYTVHSPSVLEQKVRWSAEGIKGKIKWMFGQSQLKRFEGGLLEKVDKIHTLSLFTKSMINGFYGVGGKATVIPHWCREGFFRQYSKQEAKGFLDWPREARMLFSARRLAPRMGLDIAIKALAPLLKEHSEVFFAIVGSGPLEGSLKQLAGSLGIADKVWFLGRVSDETLKRCYEAADLFILPTRALECFGLPVLESFAYGLPIISTDAAALPELMEPILPNCIVPTDSVEALMEKVRVYLKGELNLPSSEMLISHVKERYGSQKISPRIVEFLESW